MRNKSIRRACLLIASLLLACSQFNIVHPANAIITGVGVYACPDGIVLRATEDDLTANAPRVSFNISGGPAGDAGVVGDTVVNVTNGTKIVPTRVFIYWVGAKLKAVAKGKMAAQQQNNARYSDFTVESTCPPLGSVRGVAFEDRNANGVREAGEPLLYDAHYKISGGGDWYVCGYVGGDATYGVPVKPGTYYVIPVALPGWRTTTPRLKALVETFSFATLNNDIGFVRDPQAKGDVCSQYDPPNPVLSAKPVSSIPYFIIPDRTPVPTKVIKRRH